ncbi:MAG TPA: 3-hydroxyacyl-ACP dehydratase FabZ family protein [Candidatus Wallbacteria bacterium]|nr:3-hydroxyacyl-ACP dehydratase FabZ family protein [Candidatus Wallbacteria bacterium]
MNEIESLIPHRPPFLFVNQIISADKDTIVGLKTFDDSFEGFEGYFPDKKLVPGVILVESMAQCGGAGVREAGFAREGLFVLAVIENARFLGIVNFGDTVKMTIKNHRITDKAIKQSGICEVDGKIVIEAKWLSMNTLNAG